MLLLKDNPTTQEPPLLNNAFGKDLAFQIPPLRCVDLTPYFNVVTFTIRLLVMFLFIYLFYLLSTQDALSITATASGSPGVQQIHWMLLNWIFFLFFFHFFCHFVFVTQKNSVRHFFLFSFVFQEEVMICCPLMIMISWFGLHLGGKGHIINQLRHIIRIMKLPN